MSRPPWSVSTIIPYIKRYCPPGSTRLYDETSPRGLLGLAALILKPLLAACRCCIQAWAWLGREACGRSRLRWMPESIGTVVFLSTLVTKVLQYHLTAKLRNPLGQEWRGARSSNAPRDLYPMRAAAWTSFPEMRCFFYLITISDASTAGPACTRFNCLQWGSDTTPFLTANLIPFLIVISCSWKSCALAGLTRVTQACNFDVRGGPRRRDITSERRPTADCM